MEASNDVEMAEASTTNTPAQSTTNNTTDIMPPFSLKFFTKTYALFNSLPTNAAAATITATNPEELSPNPILSGQEWLMQAALVDFLEEIRTHFHCQNDVKIKFPSLNNIALNNNMLWAQEIHLCDLATMHTTIYGCDAVFSMEIEEEKSSFVTEYNTLIELVESSKAKKCHDVKMEETNDNAKSEDTSNNNNNTNNNTTNNNNNNNNNDGSINQNNPAPAVEESAEEDVLIDDEAAPISETVNKMNEHIEPQTAAGVNSETSQSPTSETTAEEMQISSVDSPVVGPLIEKVVSELGTGETSLEENRSTHYLKSSNTSSESANNATAVTTESDATTTAPEEESLQPKSVTQEGAAAEIEANVDGDEESAPAAMPLVPPPSISSSASSVTSIGVNESTPSLPAAAAAPTSTEVSIAESEGAAPAQSDGQAGADNDDVNVDDVDMDNTTSDSKKKRAREDPVSGETDSNNMQISAAGDQMAEEDVDIAGSDLQEFDHVPKRAKLSEVDVSVTD